MKSILQRKRLRQTGVDAGVWMNIQYLEEPAPLTPEYQMDVLNADTGRLDFNQAQLELLERMGKKDRVETLEKSIKSQINAKTP